ncbi:MAG: hypothetical protein ACMUJM_00175 [bacterium]
MEIIINLLIVFFVIKIIYQAARRFEKQQKEQMQQKREFTLKEKKRKIDLMKKETSKKTKLTYTKLKEGKVIESALARNPAASESLNKKAPSPDFSREEEYTFDLVQGIIMSEILGPPLAKRQHFWAFSQRG